MSSKKIPKKIMISSIMRDFADVRDEVARIITKSQNVPIRAEEYIGLEPSKEVIEKMVDDSDCYIGIFHKEWGWIPPNNNPKKLSVTALEYERAKVHNMPRLILVSNLEKKPELQEFLDTIGDYYDGQFFLKYNTIPELVGTVGLSISKLIEKISNTTKNLTDIKKGINEYTEKFKLSIKDTIIDMYEEPSDFESIFNIVSRENCWIIGERGIGKSVILKKITEQLQTQQKNVISIRSEEIQLKRDFLQVSKNDVGESLDKIIRDITQSEDLFLIVDAVDAIPRNNDAWMSFSTELDNLQRNPKIHTILAIRKSDYIAYQEKFKRNWGREVFLNGFTEEQIRKILSKLGVNDQINPTLYSIFKHPFYLEILADLIKKGKVTNISEFTNQYHFLKSHYDQVIRNSEKGSDLVGKRSALLFTIAEKMMKTKHLEISNLGFPSTPEYDSLRSDGIIIEDEYFVQFFHQVYFDFIMSLNILQNHNLSEYLQNIGNELFLHSTIRCTLALLRNSNEGEYLRNIKNILNLPEIEFYWKMAIIEFITSLFNVTDNEIHTVGEVLKTNSELQGFFLKYVTEQNNPMWYTNWKDTLFKSWSNDTNFRYGTELSKYATMSMRRLRNG